jgi:diguanylate cyclase (GGDEF)-like protein
VAASLVVLGTIGSVFGAQAVDRSESQRSRQAFVTSSMGIASTLELTIQHEQDLVVATGAAIVDSPDMSQPAFVKWTSEVRAFERYPEVQGIAVLVMVPASQLSTFGARAVLDPAGPLAAGGTFQVTPSGNRPYYCLATVSEGRSGASTTPAGLDFCATGLGGPLLSARDSGQTAYLPYGTGSGEELVLGTPLYVGGTTPGTVQARRAAFLGWTGTSINPKLILTTALRDHPTTAVAFHYGSGNSQVTFNAGTAPPGAQSTTVELHNGWTVVVFGPAGISGRFANGTGAAVLLGGIAISLLLAAVLLLLGTSRARALLLVDERTRQLRFQAFHDSLTGLPNRALILDRMGSMLARARRDEVPVATMFLDIDDFKDINDTLGHEAGDQLLAGVATRLTGILREADTVGRLGGDEFVVLVEGASLAAGAEAVADRILDALKAPFAMPGGAPLTIQASIGIATGAQGTPEELLRDADIALYRAKSTGKNGAVVFTPSMKTAVDEHRFLDVDLHRALDAGELFLVYQPIVELSSGAITGVEALLRWHHPDKGVIGPDDFIPALEASGLIVPVGKWGLLEACRQGAAWEREGHHLMISVNVAAAQLERDRFVDDVRGALALSELDPRQLTLELTETTLMRNVLATTARLKVLKSIGIQIAIDDFGTGYSSMAYLQEFPIDVLKIDGSFVSRISDSTESGALVHTLIQLGKILGIATTAEGIETDTQRTWLWAEGVDSGQGYLFAKPLDAQAMSRFLEEAADTSAALAPTP